jgi:hypothetical protein
MAEPFSIIKFFSGMLSGTHWAKTVSFGLSAAFLIFVGIGVWRGYFKKPLPTTEQRAESINNYHYNPQPRFGCATVKVYEKHPVNGVNK